MPFNLKNRDLLTLRDYTPQEIEFLLKLSADLKAAKYAGTEQPCLQGKNIALIFEKDSTRTRISFEDPENPAVQISGTRGSVDITDADLSRAKQALEQAGINVLQASLENNSGLIRLLDRKSVV